MKPPIQITTIEYSAHQDKSYDKAFKPDIYINGKWVYTSLHCKKTMRGALNSAKRFADDWAENYSDNPYCDVRVKPRKN